MGGEVECLVLRRMDAPRIGPHRRPHQHRSERHRQGGGRVRRPAVGPLHGALGTGTCAVSLHRV
ncbi:hypothetical protein C6A85_15150, partial [Mycobacterium sp. ITM-2017-0098]